MMLTTTVIIDVPLLSVVCVFIIIKPAENVPSFFFAFWSNPFSGLDEQNALDGAREYRHHDDDDGVG